MVDHSMQSSPRNSRRWLFGLLVLLVIAGLCWKFWPAGSASKDAPAQKAASGHVGRSGSMRPGFGGAAGAVPVRVAPAVVGDFPLYYKALGTVTATNTVNVRSRVAGELVKIHFKEGQQVKAGDLLAEIDPRPYRIALQQAEDGAVEGIFTVIQSPARRQAFLITPMLVSSGYDFYTLRSNNFHYSQPDDLRGRQVGDGPSQVGRRQGLRGARP